MTQRRGLGRGLDSLLNQGSPDEGADEGGEIYNLPVDLIHPGESQPRRQLDEVALQELAESIRLHGMVQPLVVRERSEGRGYELIVGERRWRAARMVNLDTVPALVRSLTSDQALAIALIENIQREELTPIEEAQAFQRLIQEFDLTHEGVATQVARSRTAVSNSLRLLSLPLEIQKALEEGQLRMGHARSLLSLEDPNQLEEIAHEVIQQGLSVRATEDRVRHYLKAREQNQPSTGRRATRKDPNVEQLEQELGERLGARVQITQKKNKGRLVIEYSSLEELEGILGRIH